MCAVSPPDVTQAGGHPRARRMTRNFIWMLAAARRKQIWRAERAVSCAPVAVSSGYACAHRSAYANQCLLCSAARTMLY